MLPKRSKAPQINTICEKCAGQTEKRIISVKKVSCDILIVARHFCIMRYKGFS